MLITRCFVSTKVIISGQKNASAVNQNFPKKLEQGDVISTIYSHGLGGFYERDAKSIYTLKGGTEETYEPNFFYSGFRYIQVKLKNPKNV